MLHSYTQSLMMPRQDEKQTHKHNRLYSDQQSGTDDVTEQNTEQNHQQSALKNFPRPQELQEARTLFIKYHVHQTCEPDEGRMNKSLVDPENSPAPLDF